MSWFKNSATRIIFSRFVLLLLVIMFMIEFVKGALLVSILPVYFKSGLGLSAFAVGWAMSLQYIGDNVFRTPIGWLVDRIGFRYSMLFGVAVTFGAVAILAVFSSFTWMIVGSALLGIGTSPLWPCVITGATEVAGEEARGTVLSVVYTAWMTGVGLGPVVINFFIQGSNYALAFRILLGLMAVVTLASIFLPNQKLSEIGQANGGAAPAEAPRELKRTGSRMERIRSYFAELREEMDVSPLFFVALFAQTFALGILTPIITLYAREELHLTPAAYSLFLIFGGGITVAALIPVGKWVDKAGSKWFLHIGFGLAAVTMTIFPSIHQMPLLYIFVAGLGISYALIIPAWNALIASTVPKEKKGAVWGFILTIEGAGMIIGPIVSGKLWDVFGPQAPFLLSGSVLGVLFALHIYLSARNKHVAVSA